MLCVKRRKERSYHGYSLSVLKSGIQKYIRRGNLEKALWCAIELDLFRELETESKELTKYLIKHKDTDRKTVKANAKRIRSNMINRLLVICSEDIGIAEWWLPAEIFKLYTLWQKHRLATESQKYLIEMVNLLVHSKKLRLISDLKSVYNLRPYYMKDLKKLAPLHKLAVEDLALPSDASISPQGWYALLQNNDINLFIPVSMLMEQTDWKKNCTKIWKELLKSNVNPQIKPQVEALNQIYKKMTHAERPIYLYHALLLVLNQNRFNYSLAGSTALPINSNPYTDHQKIELDSYVHDIHTGKKVGNDLARFALEGAFVENECTEFFWPEARDAYIKFKLILDRYNRGEKDISTLRIESTCDLLGVPVEPVPKGFNLDNIPQCQKLTATYKKKVKAWTGPDGVQYVVKGPYKPTDKTLLLNLITTAQLIELEDHLKLPVELRSALSWKAVLKVPGTAKRHPRYYLVARNVGNTEHLESEICSSKMETDVDVIKRGTMVKRVSELTETELTPEIQRATLQHLYLRYLLGTGDSGDHNILVISDPSKFGGQLIVGNDLEEKRKRKPLKSKWEALFKRPSKKNKKWYAGSIDSVVVIPDHPEHGDYSTLPAT